MSQPHIVQIFRPPSITFASYRPNPAMRSKLTDMETFKSRLIDAAQHFGIGASPAHIAKWLGIEHRQVVHTWFGVGKPSAKYLPLFQLKGINADWLLTGHGEMLIAPSQKQNESARGHDKALQEIQMAWDTLSQKQRQAIKEAAIELAKSFARANATRGAPATSLPDARSGGSGRRAKNGGSAGRRRS